MGYSPWGRKESDMTERLHFHVYYIYIFILYILLKLVIPVSEETNTTSFQEVSGGFSLTPTSQVPPIPSPGKVMFYLSMLKHSNLEKIVQRDIGGLF